MLGLIFARNRSYFSTYCTASNPVYRIREEFAILIQGDAQAAAYLLEKNPKAHPLPRDHLGCRRFGQHHVVDGIAQRQRAVATQTQERADQALYRAKRSGPRPTLSLLTGLASFLFIFKILP